MKLSDFETLQDAKDHVEITHELITANEMNALLAELKLYIPLKKIAETDGHIAQNEVAVFLDSKSTTYNFIQGTRVGDKLIMLFDYLISLADELNTIVGSETVDVASKLVELKSMALSITNQPHNPFKNVSAYDFGVTKDSLPKLKVTNVRGFIVIRYNRNNEIHNPVVFAQNDRTGKLDMIGRFARVSTSGAYEFAVPSKNRNDDLFIYNYGGVIV